MKRDPEIVDLQRYRQAARAKAAAKTAKPGPGRPGPESLLGSRPRAGLILVLIAAAMLAIWIIPKVL